MISFRVVLWITLWITHILNIILRATNRTFSDCLRIVKSELFRLLRVKFSSSSFYYYCLIFKYLIIGLSSSSLKAFNILKRNFSDFSNSVLSIKLKINTLIKSFSKLNLPISEVYIKLCFRRLPPLQNLRAERFFGGIRAAISYLSGYIILRAHMKNVGTLISFFFFPSLRLNPEHSIFYKSSCKRTFYPKGKIT